MRALVTLLSVSIWIHVVIAAIRHSPPTTSTTETPNSPKVISTTSGNYSISFVPLITLLAGVIPRIINRIRQPTQTTDARELEIETTTPGIPRDFKGANPCLDSILVRRPYPGNDCFFYQCELYEPSSPICRFQVLKDPDSPRDIDYKTVERKSSLLRISTCLAIRLYKCSAGHVYDKTEKKCIRTIGAYSDEDICVSR